MGRKKILGDGFVMEQSLYERNPKGWDEVDGVKLPSVSPWAQLEQQDIDRVHAIWSRGQHVVGDH